MTTNTTEAGGEPENDNADEMTGWQMLATAGICFVTMAIVVGTILVANGVALPVSDPGGLNPLADGDDDDDGDVVPYSEPAQTQTANESDENGSDDADDGQADLLPGADERRSDGDTSDSDGGSDGTDSDGADSSVDQPQPAEEPSDTDAGDGDVNDSDSEPIGIRNDTGNGTVITDPNTIGYEPRECDTLPGTDPNRTWTDNDTGVLTPCKNYDYDDETGGNGTGTDTDETDNWTDEERREAAEMIQQYYEGYLAGISMATDAGWSTEQNQIRGDEPAGDRDPWPLEEWNSTDEAFEEGRHLGGGEGAQPIVDEYRAKQDNATYNYSDSG